MTTEYTPAKLVQIEHMLNSIVDDARTSGRSTTEIDCDFVVIFASRRITRDPKSAIAPYLIEQCNAALEFNPDAYIEMEVSDLVEILK